MDGQPSQAATPSFDNSYARLPDHFHSRTAPTPVSNPALIRLNMELAAELGLDADWLASDDGIAMLSGNGLPDGAEPIAQAYAGHQFGNWVPQLGDGRAILLGEVIDQSGNRRDIQLKGSGPTPFSRMGDGRAPLGPVLREYIVSEAMAALGVPSTRALAAVTSGDPVVRETVEPGAILTRVASSHIRVGTFQFFAARRDTQALQALTDHVIARHYPEVADAETPALALLDAVIARQARLIAKWMGLGFIHGVMNTDNMTISGETIDFGPCAFMDAFHPAQVFSFIDQGGRYAFANQPRIANWNLAQFAQSLLDLIPGDQEQAIANAQAAIDGFADIWLNDWLSIMRAKIGLCEAQESDQALIEELLDLMATNGADFTLTFRLLADALPGATGPGPKGQFSDASGYDAWIVKWHDRLLREKSEPGARRDAMLATNPLYIPRNHLVERAIAAALDDDFQPFHDLVDVTSNPFVEQDGRDRFAQPAKPEEKVHQTFCGT